MLAMQIRQSLKAVILGYVLCLVAEVALLVWWLSSQPQPYLLYSLAIPVILTFFVAVRHMRRRLTKITVFGDRLRYESGLFSKTTRTVELAKVQDVRVDQTVGQRMLGVGNISLETAGGSSRMMMESIDRPQEAADHILELARAAGRIETRPPAGPEGPHS
jgi:putative membrane protein